MSENTDRLMPATAYDEVPGQGFTEGQKQFLRYYTGFLMVTPEGCGSGLSGSRVRRFSAVEPVKSARYLAFRV